jgi:hypothetical protein
MAQHDNKKDPALTLYITTVDYNRRDPVFWIQAKVRREDGIKVALRVLDKALDLTHFGASSRRQT